MKALNSLVRSVFVLSVSIGCLLAFAGRTAAAADDPIPAIIRSGFEFIARQRPEKAIDAWREGGLVGEEFRSVPHGTYFLEAERTLGKFVSYDHITTKMIGSSSKIVFVAINYERGAIYSRFLTYKTAKDWVVQSMYFNTKPEALMPWLAFEGEQ